MLSIGLMSGTSMDGIDAALIKTDGSANLLKELAHTSISYTPEFKILLKAAEYAVRRHRGRLVDAASDFEASLRDYLTQELLISPEDVPQKLTQLKNYLRGQCSLNAVIEHSTQLHALTVKNLLEISGYSAAQIHVIGYHGQTFFHQPRQKISIIVGNGQYLADLVGIPVVNDFRSQDIAAGGEGAPLAPLYHQALATRDNKIPVAVVNCGGIANITLINSSNPADLIAFDPGPGNGLIDQLVRKRTQGQEFMDADGQYGQRGRVHSELFAALYAQSIVKNQVSYFTLPPPKSLDVGDLHLIPELDPLDLADACATLEAFTADAIVSSLNLINAEPPPQWILAGGGWRNPIIRRELQLRLQQLNPRIDIKTADEAGWNTQALEAQIFAFLAVRSLQNQPLSFPGTTGVPHPLSGGATYFPQNFVTQPHCDKVMQ